MVKENREMLIKIIDWSSRIIAVVLAIGAAFDTMSSSVVKNRYPGDPAWLIFMFFVIMYFAFQLGLFFAPDARQKGIICKVGIGILMLPSLVGFITNMFSNKFIVYNIGFILLILLYTVQYYLIFKGKRQMQTDNILNYIKDINWMSRIIAISLAFSTPLIVIPYAFALTDSGESVIGVLMFLVIIFSFSQLGLFFASVIKTKWLICRIGIALLMLPGCVVCLILCCVKFSGVFLVGVMGVILYIIQYNNLLFEDMLAKEIT